MAEQTIITTRLDGKSIEDTMGEAENAEVVSSEVIPVEEVSSISPESWETMMNTVSWESAKKMIPDNDLVLHEEVGHSGPHIVSMKSDYIIDGLPITATVFTTLLFLWLVFAFCIRAKWLVEETRWKMRTGVVSFIDIFYNFMVDAFDGDKKYAKMYFPLIAWFFVIILFGNLFGLVIDWFWTFIPSVHYYLRPIHSDLATTVPLAITAVVYSLYIAGKSNWFWNTAKGYLFNWSGNSIAEKCVNVFVGWLHLVWIPSTMASLSLRLFGNIFAGIILISVLWFLGGMATSWAFGIGVLMTIPFWFFELFVAFVQAAVFSMLMIALFKQAHEHH